MKTNTAPTADELRRINAPYDEGSTKGWTIKLLQWRIETAGKTLSRTGLYKHIAALGLKPITGAQRPARYPTDSAQKILIRLGCPNFVPPRRVRPGDKLVKISGVKRNGKRH